MFEFEQLKRKINKLKEKSQRSQFEHWKAKVKAYTEVLNEIDKIEKEEDKAFTVWAEENGYNEKS